MVRKKQKRQNCATTNNTEL